jgi:hypothetical protein
LIAAANRFLPRLPKEVQPLNLVHDEFDGLAPKEFLLPASEIIAAEFDAVFKQFYGNRLAVKVDAYVGRSWADKCKLKDFLKIL